MKVNVAGAGAGKTTQMADIIIKQDVPEGKIIFCIAFTNAAADNITEKVAKKLGEIPDNIKISTIHSFLYQEIVEPYYYFLYGKNYKRLSVINLPTNDGYKAAKLSELEKADELHITKIPDKAKWVVHQKSSDKKAIKETRKRILSLFSSYCAAIYVDEAQDISDDIRLILMELENVGIEIVLFGDPKQDVKGYGCFRQIIDNTDVVNYITECHRCPQIHLNLSNTLASDNEKQIADPDNNIGSLDIVFESDIENINDYFKSADFGLCYISQKHGIFSTHNLQRGDDRFESLHHEVFRAIDEKWNGLQPEIEIKRGAFFITEKMLESFDQSGDAGTLISQYVKHGVFNQLSKQRYAQMASAFQRNETTSNCEIVVRSIEIIKGLEANRCLFILTSDLAPYLFRSKIDDNKMSHLLYVALTRSKDHLTILISRDVEMVFSKDYIKEFFDVFH